MKRYTTILGITFLIAALAVPVFAWGPGTGKRSGKMGFYGRESGYCGQPYSGSGNLTQEQRTQLDQLNKKFFDETADLRNEIRTKSTKLLDLLNSNDFDPDEVKAIQKEISDLRANIAEKRLNYELEARKFDPDVRFGRGYDAGFGQDVGPTMSYGRGSRGFGPGAVGCY